jgi:hypothetical protein
MEEVRIRGKFLRIQDVDDGDPTNELVVSKWFYRMNLIKPSKICVGLHQEDERKSRVSALRPNIDIGLAILRWTSEGL